MGGRCQAAQATPASAVFCCLLPRQWTEPPWHVRILCGTRDATEEHWRGRLVGWDSEVRRATQADAGRRRPAVRYTAGAAARRRALTGRVLRPRLPLGGTLVRALPGFVGLLVDLAGAVDLEVSVLVRAGLLVVLEDLLVLLLLALHSELEAAVQRQHERLPVLVLELVRGDSELVRARHLLGHDPVVRLPPLALRVAVLANNDNRRRLEKRPIKRSRLSCSPLSAYAPPARPHSPRRWRHVTRTRKRNSTLASSASLPEQST